MSGHYDTHVYVEVSEVSKERTDRAQCWTSGAFKSEPFAVGGELL